MRAIPISPKQAAGMGWTRVDPKPWGKLKADWRHVDGWRLKHCGHPTAHHSWMLFDPEGQMVLTGALQEGGQSSDGTGTISRFVHGTCWDTLRRAMEWVATQGARP